MDNRRQMFLVEAFNKEEAVRFAWHLKYSKAFAKQAAASTNKKLQTEAGMMQLNSTIVKRIRNLEGEMKPECAGTSSEVARGEGGGTQPVILHDMRPVSPQSISLLYKGISAHEEGRYAYLNKRKMKSPEQKYEFPITASSLYGWKIMDFSTPKSSAFARTCIVRDTFYRSSGIII